MVNDTETPDLPALTKTLVGAVQEARKAYAQAFEHLEDDLKCFIRARMTPYDSREAEGICQEVYLRGWRALSTFTEGNLKAWLFMIAKNRLMDWKKKRIPIPGSIVG